MTFGLPETFLNAAGLAGSHEAWLFAAAVLALNATPGVDLLLTLTRTLQGGFRAGFAAAAGINAGCVVHALAAASGLAALLAVSATAFTVVKALGAAYLLWLAVGLLRQALAANPHAASGDAAAEGAAPVQAGAWADFRLGLLTNVLNPKVALFFLAFLPQFISPSAVDKTQAFLVLGAWFVLQSSVFLALLVLLGGQLKRWHWPDALRRAWLGLVGLTFGALAVRLALAKLPAT